MWDKISIIIAVVGLIVGLSSTVFREPLVINLELNEVSKVNIENNFFKTDQGIIINNFRNTVIYPDDKLTYKTILVNKHETPVEYTAFIILRQGGKQVLDPIQLETRNLTMPNHWTTYQKEFFVGDEGIKELEIQIQGKDPKTGEMITSGHFIKDIQVLSLSEKLQSDQNNLTFWGLFASSVIGGGTLGALYFSQKTASKEIEKLDEQNTHLKTQNELLQGQSDEQNKLAKQNNQNQGLLEVMKIFNSDNHAHKRHTIYESYRNDKLYTTEGDIQTDELRRMVASVRGAFDNFGILVEVEFINKEHFLSLYCGSVIRMYKVLQRHITYEREKRGTKNFATNFEKIFDDSRTYWKEKFPKTVEPEPY